LKTRTGSPITGTFSLDPTKKPQTIDVELGDGGAGNGKLMGIYEHIGDRRRSCFSLNSTTRPARWGQKDCISFEWSRPKK
jgi:uncharacterized protein (TIGR03067 family)